MVDFNKYGLHELRKYGWAIGVASPTACTKTELIKRIKDVESGLVKPHYSKRGRPNVNAKVIDVNAIDLEKIINEKASFRKKELLLQELENQADIMIRLQKLEEQMDKLQRISLEFFSKLTLL